MFIMHKLCLNKLIFVRILTYCLYLICSVLYPAHSLNIASMYMKMGRLYIVLDRKSTGISALQKVHAPPKLTGPYIISNLYDVLLWKTKADI